MFDTKPRLDMPRHPRERVRGAGGPGGEIAVEAAMRIQEGGR